MSETKELVILELLKREIRPIRNWHEWLERWNAVETIEEIIGLLHIGFSVVLERQMYYEKTYDAIDRLTFYFNTADGWANDRLLRTSEKENGEEKKYQFGFDTYGNWIHRTSSEMRQLVADKAFNMLCQNFFKVELYEGRNGYEGDWRKIVVSERLFPIIQSFFRIQKQRFGNDIEIRNLPNRCEKSHNGQLIIDFLLSLAKFIWGWKERDNFGNKETREQNTAMRIRLNDAKLWMIEVLLELSKLNLLREWIFELDKPCLAKLKEISLRNRFSFYTHPVYKDRPVTTIDEACYLGSSTGWLLKEYELKTREHKRLTSILDAERKKEEADRKIRKLSPK